METTEIEMTNTADPSETPGKAKNAGKQRQANAQKRWAERSPAQRAGSIVMGIVNVTLLVLALLDLRRRPASEINGSKRLWVAIVFIQPVGPIAYFVFGRKRH